MAKQTGPQRKLGVDFEQKPNNSEMVRYLSLLWYEGDKECRREFKDNGNWSAIIEAEKFLQSLPIN